MTPRSSLIGDGLSSAAMSVRKAAPSDAATIDQLAIEAESVARMDPPDMRPDRAA